MFDGPAGWSLNGHEYHPAEAVGLSGFGRFVSRGPSDSGGFCNPHGVAEQDGPDFFAALITNNDAVIENPLAFTDRFSPYLSGRIGGTKQGRGCIAQLDTFFVAALHIIAKMKEKARHLSWLQSLA